MSVTVKLDDLSSPIVQSLVLEHLKDMLKNTPLASCHALPLEKLSEPNITFWSAWIDNELCGCGALKSLDHQHGEIKSMRTKAKFLRKGVASALLHEITAEAKRRDYKKLSLETGSTESFKAARHLYIRNGFNYCAPFGDYELDPLSVYMTKLL